MLKLVSVVCAVIAAMLVVLLGTPAISLFVTAAIAAVTTLTDGNITVAISASAGVTGFVSPFAAVMVYREMLDGATTTIIEEDVIVVKEIAIVGFNKPVEWKYRRMAEQAIEVSTGIRGEADPRLIHAVAHDIKARGYKDICAVEELIKSL